MASATASDTASEAAALLKARKTGIKDERKALDAEERQIDRALKVLDASTPKRTARPALPAAGGTGGGNRSAAKASTTKAPRKRRTGTRRDEALEMVRKAGADGIDASKIAKKMKIKPNYLYRVMGGLSDEKLVRKDGRTYYPLPHAA